MDAGGGTGKWAIQIAKLGYNVTLADVSGRMLEVVRQKLAKENLLDRVRIIEADITRTNMFNDESFDLSSAKAIHHRTASTPTGGSRS